MSDTEDGSDGADDGADGADADGADNDGADDFDKEAEREKLREQYERDQKRREATQHMSDLLLKGATMTNAHCDDCGSPIFRYDGEAFCPTCAGTRGVADPAAGDGGPDEQAAGDGRADGRTAGDGQAGGRATDAEGSTAGADPRQDDGGSPAADADGRLDAAGRPDADGRSDPDAGADVPAGTSRPDPTGDAPADAGGVDVSIGDDGRDGEPDDLEAARRRLDERAAGRSPDLGGTSERRTDPPRPTDSPVRQGEVPSMAQSRASLRRAIVSLSEQAAQSDDPGRAHDLLKGAREAAEALAALEGTSGE